MNTCTVCVLMPCHIPLKTTNCSSKLNSSIKTHHDQHIQCREAHENLERGGVTVSDMYKCVSVLVLQYIIELYYYYSIVLHGVMRLEHIYLHHTNTILSE